MCYLLVSVQQSIQKYIPSKMVSHEIGIFSKVYGFKSKTTETLAAIYGLVLAGGGASTTRLGTPFSIHSFLILRSPFTLRNPLSLFLSHSCCSLDCWKILQIAGDFGYEELGKKTTVYQDPNVGWASYKMRQFKAQSRPINV